VGRRLILPYKQEVGSSSLPAPTPVLVVSIEDTWLTTFGVLASKMAACDLLEPGFCPRRGSNVLVGRTRVLAQLPHMRGQGPGRLQRDQHAVGSGRMLEWASCFTRMPAMTPATATRTTTHTGNPRSMAATITKPSNSAMTVKAMSSR
jgi:hypothetical protein